MASVRRGEMTAPNFRSGMFGFRAEAQNMPAMIVSRQNRHWQSGKGRAKAKQDENSRAGEKIKAGEKSHHLIRRQLPLRAQRIIKVQLAMTEYRINPRLAHILRRGQQQILKLHAAKAGKFMAYQSRRAGDTRAGVE